MNTTTRILIATIVLGTAANSYAKSPQQIISQFARAYQGNANKAPVRHVSKKQSFGGGFKTGGKGFGYSKGFPSGGSHCEGPYCPPTPPVYPPHCDGGYCPPPQPPVCYIYIVYYYDCHSGWLYYGTYHHFHDAQAAVNSLQYQGYRAYSKRMTR